MARSIAKRYSWLVRLDAAKRSGRVVRIRDLGTVTIYLTRRDAILAWASAIEAGFDAEILAAPLTRA